MQFVVRLWLVAFTTLAVAQSRPLVFEGKAVITVSDLAYAEFGGAVAIEGPLALITATACEERRCRGNPWWRDAAAFDDFVAYQP